MNKAYKNQRLITRYAKAYYTLYKDQITLQERNRMIDLSELLEKKKTFLILIDTTLKAHTDLKVSIFVDYFKKYYLNLPFDVLIRLLLEHHNRLVLLPLIFKQIVNLYDEEKQIAIFQVTTASSIKEDIKAEICSFLTSITKKKVYCNYGIDASLIAGFRAQSKEFLYEDSVRKKLQTLTHLMD